MASFFIHMCVCDEINKKIKKDRNKILIGSIAPDIAKLVGINRAITHFGECDIDLFLSKYKENLNDDFVLGYFIHLYTDYLWDSYFINKIYKDGVVTLLDGSKKKCDDVCEYLYKDYDSITEDLISEYNMDLSFLKEETPKIPNIVEEIPMNKLNIVINKAYEFLTKKSKNKLYVMNMNLINEFIFLCKNEITKKIDKIV